MSQISYYCRKCLGDTTHSIVNFNEKNDNMNYAKIQCVGKCHSEGFVVEYSKQCTAPCYNSRRASEVVGTIDEQPTDIC